jgi:glyoxylase-like metal-dependent hydrolase (beta-lactamase superfamily II)
MWECSESIGLARGAVASNVWLLTDARGQRFLVDTGDRLERPMLWLALQRAGVRRPGDLTAILLTHRHRDHAGNAQWLRERLRCPVVCHEYDAPFLSGGRQPPRLRHGAGSRLEETICRLEDFRPARSVVDEAIGAGRLRDDFVVYPAFGHSEGSVLIHHEPTQTLFTGDALLTGDPPLRFFERFYLAVPAFSVDVENCHRLTMDFLRDPPPIRQLCAGHGPFVGRAADVKLRRFCERQPR